MAPSATHSPMKDISTETALFAIAVGCALVCAMFAIAAFGHGDDFATELARRYLTFAILSGVAGIVAIIFLIAGIIEYRKNRNE